MISGALLFIFCILLGLLLIVSVIFMIISFANSYKSKFVWLALFAVSFIGLIACIYLLVTKIANKAAEFGSTLAQSNYAINAGENYYFADSLNSKQIQYLKAIEPTDASGTVPTQFYHYLGFGHYYRLPLTYPFSLHCEDRLEKASLYDESAVKIFNQNDNGEKECGLNGITDFVLDENLMIAKVNKRDFETNEDYYVVYHFKEGKSEKFDSEDKAVAHARLLQFSRPVTLISCAEYYKLLKK